MYPRIWSITMAELAECIVTIVAILVNTTQDPNLNFQFGTTSSDFPRFSMVDSCATCDTDLDITVGAGSVQPPTFSMQHDLKIMFHSHKKILFSQNVFANISVSVVYLLDHVFSY